MNSSGGWNCRFKLFPLVLLTWFKNFLKLT